MVWIRDDAQPLQRVVPAPLEAVWAAVPLAFRDLGYTAGPSTRAGERVYLTPYLAIRDRLYQGEVLVEGNANDRAQRAASVHCTGTGRLETAILERLEAHLRPPPQERKATWNQVCFLPRS